MYVPAIRQRLPASRGFTLIETLVVIGIIAVVAAITFSLLTLDKRQKFDGEVQQTLVELRRMQSEARNANNNLEYGMTFASNGFTTFSRNPTTGAQTTLTTRTYAAASLAASVTPTASQIVFTRVTGNPQGGATATLTLSRSNPAITKVIKVESTGVMYVQ